MTNKWDDKEYRRKWNADWRSRNIDKIRKYRREYYKKNSMKRKESSHKYNKKRRLELLVFLGNKCVRCGFDDWRALQIDHINGDGHLHRKVDGSTFTAKYYMTVKNNPERFQLLCANCNWIKRYENNENRLS